MFHSARISLLLSLFVGLALTGCGKKGPLTHPEHNNKQAQQSSLAMLPLENVHLHNLDTQACINELTLSPNLNQKSFT